VNDIVFAAEGKRLDYEHAVELRTTTPVVETHFNAVYMPVHDLKRWEHDPSWGLYADDGTLIEAAAYYRGPGKTLIGQSPHQDLRGVDLEPAPRGRYLYGGSIIAHFGHYLLNSFSRYWIGTKYDLTGYKILCHGAGTPAGWWSLDFLAELFTSQGLRQSDFVVFKRPTMIPEITVPRPACEERNFTHTAYADWGHQLGRALLQDQNLPEEDAPVWMAKTRLRRGIRGLDNEQALIDRLVPRGVQVVHPHEMSMAQKVALYATRRAVMGLAGSTLHTSIFWPPTAKLVGVGFDDRIDSNNALADKANGNRITYVSAAVQPMPRNERFDQPLRLTNVEELAETILQACDL
jgi:capsular polysaccharide biosynthesis protein